MTGSYLRFERLITGENAMPTAEDITTACVALAQEARERRLELDAGRCIPADLMERAGEAGLYRQMLPVGQGGYGLTPQSGF
jgi:hypothetical protein